MSDMELADARARVERLHDYIEYSDPEDAAALSRVLAELDRLPRLREALTAATALADKLDEIDGPKLHGVFSIAAVHGFHYDGPNWGEALKEYRARLTAALETP